MNTEQYYKYKSEYPDIDNYTYFIYPEEVIKYDQSARPSGNTQKNIQRYKVQFYEDVEQDAPCSIAPLPKGAEILDGTTRARAMLLANEIIKKDNKKIEKENEKLRKKGLKEKPTRPLLKLKVSTFVYEVFGYNSDQMEDWQVVSNDHIGAEATSIEDIERLIKRRINNGRLSKIVKEENNGIALDYKNPEEIKKYLSIAAKWLKKNLFKNSPKTTKWFANRIKEELKKPAEDAAGYTTYDDQQLLKEVQKGIEPWEGNDFSTINNNNHVIIVRDRSRMHPNVGGALLQQKLDNPGVTQNIVISFTDLISKTMGQITDDRNAILKEIKRILEITESKCKVYFINQMKTDGANLTLMWDSDEVEKNESYENFENVVDIHKNV